MDTPKNAHVAPPANAPRLYDFLKQSAVEAPPQQATTDPYLLAYPAFLVDFLLRDGLVLLQFHLPFALHHNEEAPSWWLNEFAQALNQTTYEFYGAVRQDDLAAQHQRLDQRDTRYPVDSWYLEIANEEFYCHGEVTRESRTLKYLNHLARHMERIGLTDPRLPRERVPYGTHIPYPAHLDGSPDEERHRRAKQAQFRNGVVTPPPARPAAPPPEPPLSGHLPLTRPRFPQR